ncbi:MAG: FadR family transcriptional regulator [Phycisphaerae bacterium]|nr:FadR family transcriptional regulator [Phycisphaerae bacterium]
MKTRHRPLDRVPLVSAVAGRLRSLIVEGGYSAGDRLPSELELMKRWQVSRPVLREAVNRLAAVGLLTVRHGSGTFVAQREWLSSCVKLVGSSMAIGPRELMQFVEFRRVLEGYAARKAAMVAEPEQVTALGQALEEALGVVARRSPQAMEADFRFHCMLVEIGGNPLMRNLLELLHEFSMAGMRRTQPAAMSDPQGAEIHRAIVRAIRDRSPGAAERAVHAHMDLLITRLEADSAEDSSPEKREPPSESQDS